MGGQETRAQTVARLTAELAAVMRAYPWLSDAELDAMLARGVIPIVREIDLMPSASGWSVEANGQ